ncbi:MAG TPA: response regulator [Bacteroidia bacterium]|nr:response regulator [Bacteroidia bacterium]
MITVLYVDDEVQNLEAFKAAFRRSYNVLLARSAAEARKILAENKVAVLISDQRMPVETGTQLLSEAVKLYPAQVRILLTAYADMEALVNAVNQGYIFKYHSKPWNEADLGESLKQASAYFRKLKALDDMEKRIHDSISDVDRLLRSSDEQE